MPARSRPLRSITGQERADYLHALKEEADWRVRELVGKLSRRICWCCAHWSGTAAWTPSASGRSAHKLRRGTARPPHGRATDQERESKKGVGGNCWPGLGRP